MKTKEVVKDPQWSRRRNRKALCFSELCAIPSMGSVLSTVSLMNGVEIMKSI